MATDNNKRLYAIFLESKDEDGKVEPNVHDITKECTYTNDAGEEVVDSPENVTQQCIDFLSQTDFAYESNGWVIEVYDGEHQPFAKYIDDISKEAMSKIYKEIEDFGQAENIPIIKEKVEALRAKA